MESVSVRQKGSYDFESYYDSLCALNGVCPLSHVKAYLHENTIDINADRIKINEWTPFLEALKINKHLETIAIKSYYQPVHNEMGHTPIATNSAKKRIPSVCMRDTILKLSISLRDVLISNPNLKTLELYNITLRQNHLDNLIKGIERTKSLSLLSMEKCNIGDNYFEDICAVLKHATSINIVNFSQCQLTCKAAHVLSDLIMHQATVRHSLAWKESLRYQKPDLDGMGGLRRISLCLNPLIADNGLKLIADALKDDLWVKAIDLHQCNISNVGGQHMLDILKFNTTLIVVDLRRNPLIDASMMRNIMDQVIINCGGQETEYKWMKITKPSTTGGNGKVGGVIGMSKKRRARLFFLPPSNKKLYSQLIGATISSSSHRLRTGDSVKVGGSQVGGSQIGGGDDPLNSDKKASGMPWRTAMRAAWHRTGSPPITDSNKATRPTPYRHVNNDKSPSLARHQHHQQQLSDPVQTTDLPLQVGRGIIGPNQNSRKLVIAGGKNKNGLEGNGMTPFRGRMGISRQRAKSVEIIEGKKGSVGVGEGMRVSLSSRWENEAFANKAVNGETSDSHDRLNNLIMQITTKNNKIDKLQEENYHLRKMLKDQRSSLSFINGAVNGKSYKNILDITSIETSVTDRGDASANTVGNVCLNVAGNISGIVCLDVTGGGGVVANGESSLLDNESILDTIEYSFQQFHAFLDMLKQIGLGQLITMAGLDENVMPFNARNISSGNQTHAPLNNGKSRLDTTMEMKYFLENSNSRLHELNISSAYLQEAIQANTSSNNAKFYNHDDDDNNSTNSNLFLKNPKNFSQIFLPNNPIHKSFSSDKNTNREFTIGKLNAYNGDCDDFDLIGTSGNMRNNVKKVGKKLNNTINNSDEDIISNVNEKIIINKCLDLNFSDERNSDRLIGDDSSGDRPNSLLNVGKIEKTMDGFDKKMEDISYRVNDSDKSGSQFDELYRKVLKNTEDLINNGSNINNREDVINNGSNINNREDVINNGSNINASGDNRIEITDNIGTKMEESDTNGKVEGSNVIGGMSMDIIKRYRKPTYLSDENNFNINNVVYNISENNNIDPSNNFKASYDQFKLNNLSFCSSLQQKLEKNDSEKNINYKGKTITKNRNDKNNYIFDEKALSKNNYGSLIYETDKLKSGGSAKEIMLQNLFNSSGRQDSNSNLENSELPLQVEKINSNSYSPDNTNAYHRLKTEKSYSEGFSDGESKRGDRKIKSSLGYSAIGEGKEGKNDRGEISYDDVEILKVDLDRKNIMAERNNHKINNSNNNNSEERGELNRDIYPGEIDREFKRGSTTVSKDRNEEIKNVRLLKKIAKKLKDYSDQKSFSPNSSNRDRNDYNNKNDDGILYGNVTNNNKDNINKSYIIKSNKCINNNLDMFEASKEKILTCLKEKIEWSMMDKNNASRNGEMKNEGMMRNGEIKTNHYSRKFVIEGENDIDSYKASNLKVNGLVEEEVRRKSSDNEQMFNGKYSEKFNKNVPPPNRIKSLGMEPMSQQYETTGLKAMMEVSQNDNPGKDRLSSWIESQTPWNMYRGSSSDERVNDEKNGNYYYSGLLDNSNGAYNNKDNDIIGVVGTLEGKKGTGNKENDIGMLNNGNGRYIGRGDDGKKSYEKVSKDGGSIKGIYEGGVRDNKSNSVYESVMGENLKNDQVIGRGGGQVSSSGYGSKYIDNTDCKWGNDGKVDYEMGERNGGREYVTSGRVDFKSEGRKNYDVDGGMNYEGYDV